MTDHDIFSNDWKIQALEDSKISRKETYLILVGYMALALVAPFLIGYLDLGGILVVEICAISIAYPIIRQFVTKWQLDDAIKQDKEVNSK